MPQSPIVRSATPARMQLPRLLVRTVLGAGASSALNACVYLVAQHASARGLWVADGLQASSLVPLDLADVISASCIPALPAVLVAGALRSYVANWRRAFSAAAAATLLLSLLPVLLLPTGATTQLALGLMHVITTLTVTLATLWGQQ